MVRNLFFFFLSVRFIVSNNKKEEVIFDEIEIFMSAFGWCYDFQQSIKIKYRAELNWKCRQQKEKKKKGSDLVLHFWNARKSRSLVTSSHRSIIFFLLFYFSTPWIKKKKTIKIKQFSIDNNRFGWSIFCFYYSMNSVSCIFRHNWNQQ